MKNLAEKLYTINKPKIPDLQDGSANTIEEFYDKFIEPLLPNVAQVIKWHKILKWYVKQPNTVLGFRTGNEKGKLRRGWETVTNDGYSFFYTDNFFAHYFYKLACDTDYKVNKNEFKYLMTTKIFPVRISFHMGTDKDPHEKEYASFNIHGKNPGINTSGYKLAHIIDAGQNYCIDGKSYGISWIINKYFPLGTENDWMDKNNPNKHCRKLQIRDKDKTHARKFAEMSFLRMVHPMNYFLSPKSPNRSNVIYNKYNINNCKKNNIAEDKNLISYMRKKFHERYSIGGKDYFQEFLDLVNPETDSIQEDGKTKISIIYSRTPLNAKLPQEQKNFLEFLSENAQKKVQKQTARQYAIYWPEKLKKDKGIDVYTITDIEEAKRINELFKKNGDYNKYNKDSRGALSALTSKYIEYLEYKEQNQCTTTIKSHPSVI